MKKFSILDVNPNDVKFIEKNARYMSRTEYDALVNNIKRDGQLSSVPFCAKENDEYIVVSGNHRIKAAIDAGLQNIQIMVGENLSNDQIRAIQLSHNSIVGKDDMVILRELYDEIKSSDFKAYSFIDTSIFEELEKIDVNIIQPTNEFISFNIMFFDAEFSKFEDIINEIRINEKAVEALLPTPKQDYEKFIEVVGKIRKDFDIKDYGTSLIKMAELANETLKKVKQNETV